ncbi:factor activating pos9, partial [Spiromyces aspiralis]
MDTVATASRRKYPNVLITGTPGTGKTTTAELVEAATGLKQIIVGDMVKEHGLHDGYNEEFDTYMLNEDKLLDEMEPMMAEGGKVVDFHTCEIFPERWFDLVVVLRSETHNIYDRLRNRGYSQKKITENIECEIMNVLIDEARESYREEIIWELHSDTVDQMEENISRI